MIVEKNFLLKLRDFGLNTYESKLWTALLSRGSSTAGELSDIANVPRSRAYDVLESLEKKGFIIRKLGKPIKYLAVSPDQVVDRVKDRIREESRSQISTLEDLRKSDVLDELASLHQQGIELVEPTDLTGSITGRDNLYHHLESRLSKAKEKAVLLTSPAGLVRKAGFLLPTLKELKRKGVRVRIATQLTPDIQDTVRKLSEFAEVRHTDIPGRMCVLDGEVLLMLLDDRKVHPSYDMAVWINSPFLASTLHQAFEDKWKAMKG